MFEKGQEVIIEIEDMSEQGAGIGHVEGFTVFADGGLPGDECLVLLTKVKKRYATGIVIEITKPSKDRIPCICKDAAQCGGCSFTQLSYDAQLVVKHKQIRDKLIRIGEIYNPKVNDVVSMTDPFHYRNKAVVHVDTTGTRADVGFFDQRSHNVIDCDECMLQMEPVTVTTRILRSFLDDKLFYGDQINKKSCYMLHQIEDVTVRTAIGTGEVMIIIGCRNATDVMRCYDKDVENVICELIENLDDAIYEAGFSLESVYIDNSRQGVAGRNKGSYLKEPALIAGKTTIDEIIGNMKYEISPRSFYQVNPQMMKVLYDIVAVYVGDGFENMIDLYCGAGTIGTWCLKKCDGGYVVGIESERQAILDANRNAVINGIINVRYVPGRAELVLTDLVDYNNKLEKQTDISSAQIKKKKYDIEITNTVRRADVAVIDPPRSGCRPELLDALIKAAPDKIIYVSCDPATMARDIKILTDNGYTFKEATPVDMFPWTKHVECVVLMSRVK